MRYRCLAAALLAAFLGGCSISHSVNSLSDSMSNSSDSISNSSNSISDSSGGDEAAYREDVREQVLAFVQQGGSTAGFQRELGAVARRHGLTNWEADTSTYRALGEGLRASGVTGGSLETLKHQLTGGDPARMDWLQRGYDTWS